MYDDYQPQGEIGTVYLLHLAQPFDHAQHYIGWARDLTGRLKHHKRGTGAAFLRAVNEAGIEYNVVKTWSGVDRHFERKLKNRRNARLLCPICQAEKHAHAMELQRQRRAARKAAKAARHD